MYTLLFLLSQVEQKKVEVPIPDSFNGLLKLMGVLIVVVLLFPIVLDRLIGKKRRRD
ncbi:MAG: hypothetical protein K6C40_15955 [Thermoguttaceae bacterium]|jgi:hypothetical protein|nr:hypothetical protein [Thermoguttaceae bacterium]